MRYAVGITVVLLALAGAGVAAAYIVFWRQETIAIRVRAVDEVVPRGTTLAEAADRFGLHPDAGDLLDVRGDVFRADRYPGRVLVNGRRARSTTELEQGDVLRVVDGRDRREPRSLFSVPFPGGLPSDPEFTLALTPGAQELERGRMSGKVIPLGFDATGPSHTPKAIALTFDDGPSPYTPRILAVLERMHARATFFVVGQLAKEYPQLVHQELRAGMEVGSHSYSHPYRPPFDQLPRERILQEIRWGRAVIARLGPAPTLFRPPGGSFSPYVIQAAGSFGERIVLWSVDPTDWKAGTTAGELVRRVLGAVRPGSIVVLHDGGGERSATVKALPRIIRGARRMGLKLALVDPERIGPGY